MKGSFNPKELPSAISAHLKRVEVKCQTVDETVVGVLRFLSKLNICKLASDTHPFYIPAVWLCQVKSRNEKSAVHFCEGTWKIHLFGPKCLICNRETPTLYKITVNIPARDREKPF